MKITLEVVRQILKDTLGFDSFIAGFITQVTEDKEIETACINVEGVLRYNPKFATEYVSCKEDLFSLIFHELLHPMFGHFIFDNGALENIAADAIINAVISSIYCTESRDGNLFRKLYPSRGLPAILRTGSDLYRSKYEKVYRELYRENRDQDSMTTGELIQTLKILTQGEMMQSIVLIGSHSHKASPSNAAQGWSKDILAKIAEDIKRSVAGKGGRYAGFSQNLMNLFMEALKTHLSIKKVLLQKFLTKRKIDRFREHFQVRRVGVSPIPIYPSKRDLVLLAVDFYPGYFHNHVSAPRTTEKGLAIYLDVSGSVYDYLPQIIGILSNLRKEIKSIFLFSNSVVETTFEELLKGKIQTTYGTDFDCIALSIIERKFDKVVIITDGYASLSEESARALKKLGLITLTILFGEAKDCEEFTPFGDVVRLEDISQ